MLVLICHCMRRMKAAFHLRETFSKIGTKKPSRLSTDLGGKVITAPGVDIPDLAPGEPVPPGFEDVVTRVPEISSTLDVMKAPLIGLEYLAEITPTGEEKEPKYCCLLCNKRGDPRTVVAHLVCFNHRIKYIARYFPRVSTALALIPKVKEYKRGTGECLSRIVKAIESKFGRLNPVIVDGSVFDEKKEEYYLDMCGGRHFHETPDLNLDSMVDLDFIKKCAPEDTVLTIDLEKDEAKKRSSSGKVDMSFKVINKSMSEQGKRNTEKINYKVPAKKKREKSVETISTLSSNSRSRSRSRSWSRSRSVSRSRSWSGSRSRSRSRYRYMYRDYKRDEGRRTPPKYYRRSRSRSRNNSYRQYRSSNYRSRPIPSSRDTYRSSRYDSIYDEERYSERPKSTQLKVAELRDRRRKKDLYQDFVAKLEKDMAKILKGYEKNPEKHPSYPEEWKKFWNRRYKELTAEGIDASKHDFKPEWIKFWTIRMKELHSEELQMKKDKYRSELGLPDTDSSGALDSDVIEVSPTPLEDEKSNITVEDIKNTWKVLTGGDIRGTNSIETCLSPVKSDDFEGSIIAEPEQPIRVITVLRLLTALENQLGSLGPRVNNLLAQAIALEKKRENSSDSLIEISENNVLFETVKEKLKGQLFAGIVNKHMVKATRTAIENVAELFNTWKAKKNNPEVVPSVSVSTVPVTTQVAVQVPCLAAQGDPLIVPGIGAVDKLAIAQQIASALVAQGKTNVTEQELEQLINAVVGMAQASTQLSQSALLPTPVIPSPGLPTGVVESLKTEDDLDRQNRLGERAESTLFPLKNNELAQGSSGLTTARKTLPKDLSNSTEEDIKTSLQNFKDLSPEEQQRLITYLRELEYEDPESVEKLKKFVLLANETSIKTDLKAKEDSSMSGRLSPFSMREGGANPFIDERSKIHLKDMEDDEEDDYSYEEIYRAAEKKVSGKSIVEQMIAEQQKKSKKQFESSPKKETSFKSSERSFQKSSSDDPENLLSEAIVMIDNIMGQLPNKFTGGNTRMHSVRTSSSTGNTRTGGSGETPNPEPTPTSQIYNPPPVKPPENNLINDYNYQDDLFGYSNDNYQSYPSGNDVQYRGPSSHESSYEMRPNDYGGYDKNTESSYNNYDAWSDHYAQYQPPQIGGYDCQQMQSQTGPSGFNGPEVFQVPPGEFPGGPVPPYGNNVYRDYY